MDGATLMKHYKNSNGQVFGFDNDQLNLVTPDMVEITLEEIAELNKPTPEQIKQQRIAELKRLLAESDYKETPSYMAGKTDDENTAIFNQRTAWREEVRELEA